MLDALETDITYNEMYVNVNHQQREQTLTKSALNHVQTLILFPPSLPPSLYIYVHVCVAGKLINKKALSVGAAWCRVLTEEGQIGLSIN